MSPQTPRSSSLYAFNPYPPISSAVRLGELVEAGAVYLCDQEGHDWDEETDAEHQWHRDTALGFLRAIGLTKVAE